MAMSLGKERKEIEGKKWFLYVNKKRLFILAKPLKPRGKLIDAKEGGFRML